MTADVHSFTIATTSGRPEVGPRRWWWVRIYAAADLMRGAAARYDPGCDFTEAVAVCHTAPGNPHSRGGYTGIIRFTAGHMAGETVVHELVHAACAVYRSVHTPDVRLGRGVTEREEQMAYILGELYAAFEQHFHHPGPGR